MTKTIEILIENTEVGFIIAGILVWMIYGAFKNKHKK